MSRWSTRALVEHIRQRLNDPEANIEERRLALDALHELETRRRRKVLATLRQSEIRGSTEAYVAPGLWVQLRNDLRWLNSFFDLELETRHDPETWHNGDPGEIANCPVCRIAAQL